MSVYDEIREKLPLKDVVGRYTKLVSAGPGKYKGLCPLHNEKTSSFYINEELGVFHCFGCKQGGTVVDFISLKEGIPVGEVPAFVKNEFGLDIGEEGNDATRTNRKDRLDFFKLTVEYFKDENSVLEALKYLKKRVPAIEKALIDKYDIFSITNKEKVDSFLSMLTPDQLKIAESLGVYYPPQYGRTGFFTFYNRVVFPIKSYKSIIGFNGRALGTSSKKYLLTREDGIFKKKNVLWGYREAVENSKKLGVKYVYAVEGVLDALALTANGVPAVAYLGSEISHRQMQLIQTTFDHVILVPDSDKAGKLGAVNSINNAIFTMFPISGQVITLPEGLDAAEYLKDNTIDDLNELPGRTFEDFYIDFYVRRAIKAIPTHTKDALKSAFLAMILPKLLDYNTNPMSSSILMKIAERLAINPAILQLRINEGVMAARSTIKQKTKTTRDLNAFKLKITANELHILSALFTEPNLYNRLIKNVWYIQLSQYFRDVAEAIYQSYVSKEKFTNILSKKLTRVDDTVKEEYYRILNMVPNIFNKAEAVRVFGEQEHILNVIYSKKSQTLKLIGLAEEAYRMTKPLDEKERKMLSKQAKKIVEKSKNIGRDVDSGKKSKKSSAPRVL